MAQLVRKSDSFKSPNPSTTAPFEQLVQGDERCLSPNTSPNTKVYDQEEAFPTQLPQNNKKSVLTKVKERAKKLRHSLSGGGRKKPENPTPGDNSTPAWGVSLEDEDEDDDDEDPEYLGAPMYESELAPEAYKETARQHPRADPMFSEKNVLPNTIKQHENENEQRSADSSNNVSAESDASHFIGYNKFSENAEGSREGSPMKWDKGVSVKEYFMTKLEPGEDEKELSKVISDAMSPRKAAGEMGVVEKVKEVVTSFLRPQDSEDPSHTFQPSISNHGNSSPHIPVFTDTQQVCDEQTHGRILQTD